MVIQMASQDRVSFDVSYAHLAHTPIIDSITQILEILDNAAYILSLITPFPIFHY